MPSSAIRTKDVPEVADMGNVLCCYNLARENGLDLEWFAWFIGGIRQGMKPEEAAVQACEEWDI